MIRRALIIYCNNTFSGPLPGPAKDNENYINFLTSSLGGEWERNEIRSLSNPTALLVEQIKQIFLNDADYTFVIFTGHGCINTQHQNLQYAELSDGNISILKLKTNAPRQTIIFDSCRGFEQFESDEITKAIEESTKMFATKRSTRQLFDNAVSKCEQGISVLYAASEDQSASDSKDGALYLSALIRVAEDWEESETKANILPINVAHNRASLFINENALSIQVPEMVPDKRKNNFPSPEGSRRGPCFPHNSAQHRDCFVPRNDNWKKKRVNKKAQPHR